MKRGLRVYVEDNFIRIAPAPKKPGYLFVEHSPKHGLTTISRTPLILHRHLYSKPSNVVKSAWVQQ
jgi:hypothetical protein